MEPASYVFLFWYGVVVLDGVRELHGTESSGIGGNTPVDQTEPCRRDVPCRYLAHVQHHFR